MKDNVIGLGKPKGVSKSPWEHKTIKRQGCPKGKWDTAARKQHNQEAQMTILSH